MRSSRMRALLMALTTLSACSFLIPPPAGGKPPTRCRATPFVDLGLGLASTTAMFVERSRADGEAADDIRSAFTKIYGIPALVFLGTAVAGFVEYSRCRRDVAVAPPPPVVDGRRCEPEAPGSSVWTCGPGYRCTDKFDGCEPAAGRPTLRQR